MIILFLLIKQLVKNAPIKQDTDEIEKCTKPYMTKVGKWNNILPIDSFELVFANEPPIWVQCIFAIIQLQYRINV